MSENHSHKSVTYLAAALAFFGLFQISQALVDRGNLDKLQTQVEDRLKEASKAVTESQKMLDQLNAIAIGAQRLSDAGNPNAKDIVAQLNKLGIKINPNYKEDQEKAAKEAAEKAAKGDKAGEAPAAATPPAGAPPAPAPDAPPPAPEAKP